MINEKWKLKKAKWGPPSPVDGKLETGGLAHFEFFIFQ
jgi:hypothetical protein